jgi:hypothetical protein
VDKKLNQDDWRIYANDKIKFSQKMTDAGLSTPKFLALYLHNQAPPSLECAMLTNKSEAMALLQTDSLYPCFMKPVHGTFGRGAFSAESLDAGKQVIQLGDGSTRSLDEVADAFAEPWTKGYIIQELLTCHPEAAKLVGPKISSLRIVMLQVNKQYIMHRVTWRLTTGNNMSDNFMGGESGNIIAHVDAKTGVITSVLGRENGVFCRLTQHPDTRAELVGIRVPMWDRVSAYCQKAAALFPGLKLQHWDIALCEDGPMALEVNVEGGIVSHQMSGERGFYDDALAAALKEVE